MYEKGYVFTRIDRGVMQQTRSVRLDLSKFELTSENRRIIKKVPDLMIQSVDLPLGGAASDLGGRTSSYDFTIGKLAKDFYETKFGPGIMSAQKVKEMLTDQSKSNFNCLLNFSLNENAPIGFAIVYTTPTFMHYSYPFYNLNESAKDMGLAMMVKTIVFAKESGLKYVYLGSLQRPTDTYKLQFEGLEWFNRKEWSKDLEEVKKLLTMSDMVTG